MLIMLFSIQLSPPPFLLFKIKPLLMTTLSVTLGVIASIGIGFVIGWLTQSLRYEEKLTEMWNKLHEDSKST
jgi:hypothetical protein